MIRAAAACALASLLFAESARADGSLTLEAGGGASKPTHAIPASPFEYQRFVGRYEATDALQFTAQLRLTHDFATTTPGTSLKTSDDWVWLGTIGAGLDVTPHLNVSLGASGSPGTTRDIATPFDYPTGAVGSRSTFGVMHATSSSYGATIDATYDTTDDDGPERDIDGQLTIAAGYTRYAIEQAMTAFDAPAGPVSIDEAKSTCAGRATPDCAVIVQAANDARASLGQFRLGAAAGLALFTYTDVAIDFGYYLYDSGDPGDVGVYAPSSRASYGAGLPLIPQRWSLRGEVGHRWKPLSVRAYYQFTDYALSDSVGHTVGGKAQLYLGTWRVYLSGSYRHDLDAGDVATGFSVGLGVTKNL